MTLAGKVALITGSTRGIGWATARAFAKEGCTVLLNGRTSQEAVESRVAEIKSEFGVPCRGFCSDVSDPASVKSIYSAIFKEFKRLDVLVNNAGKHHDGLLATMPLGTWESIVKTNLDSTFYGCQAVMASMVSQRGGRIVNISSLSAILARSRR